MGFVLYISGCALPAIGALRALEERDIVPDALIARAGGALTGGLYACGWRADELERLAHALRHSSLALLMQLLPALRDDAARLTPGDIARRILDDEPVPDTAIASVQTHDGPEGLSALLGELTGEVTLRTLRMRLLLPVRAYAASADGSHYDDLRLISSGPNSQWALPLGTALRCAAFPADVVTSPGVGGRALSACRAEDVLAHCAELQKHIGSHELISIVRPGERMFAPSICLTIPRECSCANISAQIERGYTETHRRMSEILSFC